MKKVIVFIMMMLGIFAAALAQDDKKAKNESNKIMEEIAGTWRSIKAGTADTLGSETLVLFVDARYVRTREGGGTEKGSYRLQESHGDLILEPEDQEPISYDIQLKGSRLILTREEGEKKQQTRYMRTEDK